MATLAPLQVYPSTQARKGFSASQLAQLHSNLSNAVAQVITLPPEKRDTPSTRAFVSSYASDVSHQTVEALIWEEGDTARHNDRLQQHVLLLAEKLASSAPGLELRTILDLCVAFSFKVTRLRAILSAACSGTPDLPVIFSSKVVPAFTPLLSPSRSSGLYGLRKTACCLKNLLRPCPPVLVRSFAHNQEFLVTLARAYEDGLAALARSYGGIRLDAPNRQLDQWEKIWLDTKVDIVDAFHLIVTSMVQDISFASGAQLAVETDRTFEIMFALLDVVPQSPAVGPADAVPFLNRSLIADYQYAYDLGRTLASVLLHASRNDARMERLESSLRPLDVEQLDNGAKDPGALKLLLRSSGIAPAASISVEARPTIQPTRVDKGKGRANAPAPESGSSHDADLDLQVTQVLEIFPDHSPEYVRKLLTHPSYPFRGDAERVIGALLEGMAPDEDALGGGAGQGIETFVPKTDAPIERRNIFDQEVMDLNRVHIGKKTLGQTTLIRSKSEAERMNAGILLRVEAMSDDSEEEVGQPKALDVIDLDDDLNEASATTVKILGDDSDDDEVVPIKPETILELAYIRDPKLFDRDAETRRSKGRADLKQQTCWTDEQIEGWRIMLERNPRKERILQKHEFSGNRNLCIPIIGRHEDQLGGGQRGGSGRGGGRGRGRARGGGAGGSSGRGGGGEKNEDVARERAFKEKHKSSNRRRGHDKKMSKAGVGPSV